MNGSVAIAVVEDTHVGLARREAVVLCQRAGMDETQAGKVGIVVTEAARNILKHANKGEVLLRVLHDSSALGVEVIAVDRGPGMKDVGMCLTDGYSTAGSPGTGMGAIMRLSTTFDLYTQVGKGTVVLSQIWAKNAGSRRTGLEVGAVCVSMAERTPCGDAWDIRSNNGLAQLLVVDGLGHGVMAEKVATEALRVFDSAALVPPVELIHALHGPLRSTRGASLAISHFELKSGQLRYVGVGNISGSIVHDGKSRSMVSHNGTVGHELLRVQEFVYPWPEGATVIMHSDGLQTRWQLQDYPGLLARHPSVVAATLYRDWRRGRDDATVVVVRRK